jgi:outer membrane protein assembly factor BamB
MSLKFSSGQNQKANDGSTSGYLPGEWTCYRGNGTQDARSHGKGDIVQPGVAWKHFIGTIDTLAVATPGSGHVRMSVPLDLSAKSAGEKPAEEENDAKWGLLPVEVNIGGTRQRLWRSPTTTYAHVLPDVPGIQKIEFESSFTKPTINGKYQDCVGWCFAWQEGEWRKVWQTEVLKDVFNPCPVVGDFDDDGQPEIAILPWNELIVLDAVTGRIKDRVTFTKGRSYGWFGVYDLDGDGKSEFVVQSYFAKHVDVLGYWNGRLQLLWRKELELNFDDAQMILRAHRDPVGEVDGDGYAEVMTCIYNENGDKLWHTKAFDGINGRLKADLPGEYLNAVVDVDGDGVAELLTTHTVSSGIPKFGRISVYSVNQGELRCLWQQDNSGWQEWDPPFLPNTYSVAGSFASRDVLYRLIDGLAHVVIRKHGRKNQIVLSGSVWSSKGFVPQVKVGGPDLTALAIDGQGSMLVCCSTIPGVMESIQAAGGTLRLVRSTERSPLLAPVVVAQDPSGDKPVIVAQGTSDQLVGLSAPVNGKNRELWRINGRGGGQFGPQFFGPVIANLAGDGRRQLLYATSSASGCGRLVVSDLSHREIWHHDFPKFSGDMAYGASGGIVLFQVGHFTDSHRQDILVTVRRALMHSEETFLLSGKDGHAVWHRVREINRRGVGGIPFAVADYNGDGLDEAASLYPSILFILDCRNGRNLLAMETTWAPVPAKPVYWGMPVAGDFEGTGRPDIFFGPWQASMTGLVRSDGSLVWWDALDKSPNVLPAFGSFSGRGRMEAISIGYPEDGIRCYDSGTGAIIWRMPMPDEGRVLNTASGDINSDGRDEALAVIGRSLYCIGSDAAGTSGSVLWKVDFPAEPGPPSLADVDGTGKLSILVSCGDGYLYCLR